MKFLFIFMSLCVFTQHSRCPVMMFPVLALVRIDQTHTHTRDTLTFKSLTSLY
jgi:hypothetical protein